MLGYIEGNIISKTTETSQVVVLSQGVGYELTLSKHLLESVHVGSSGVFWLHTHVREDAFTLFGFRSEPEKKLFRILIGVSGLGPKTALSLLSEHGSQKLVKLILEKRISEIAEASGVGKKLAERLCLELSGKLEKLAWIQLMPTPQTLEATPELSAEMQLRVDLNSALQHLGYQQAHIKTILDKVLGRVENKSDGFESLLRKALSEISGRNPPLNSQEAGVV